MRNAAGSETEWRIKKGSLFLTAMLSSPLSYRFIILVHDIVVDFLTLILYDDFFQCCHQLELQIELNYIA